MRDRWVLCVVLAVALAAAGFGLSTRHQTQFTAEARLAVGSNSLQAYQVAGFAVASQALAANYARFVSGSSTTTTALTDALDGRVSEITSIGASPIPDSNVIRIEATATSSEIARAAADVLAKSLVDQVNAVARPNPGELLAEHKALTVAVLHQQANVGLLTKSKIAAQRAGQPVDSLDSALARAKARLSNLQLRQSATGVEYQQTLTQPTVENDLRNIQTAAVTGDDKRRTQELYTVSGLLAGLLVGLVLSNLLERRGRRRQPSSRRSTSTQMEVRRHG